jgi:hypothetical protein
MSEVTNHVLLVDIIMVLKSVYIDTRSVQMFLAQRIASRCDKYTYHSTIYVCDVQLMLWVLMMAQSLCFSTARKWQSQKKQQQNCRQKQTCSTETVFLALLGLEVLSDKCSSTAASPTQKKFCEQSV